MTNEQVKELLEKTLNKLPKKYKVFVIISNEETEQILVAGVGCPKCMSDKLNRLHFPHTHSEALESVDTDSLTKH